MKPNIESLPCFAQVAEVIGRTNARLELFKAVGWKKWFEKNQRGGCRVYNDDLLEAFSWLDTPQGKYFWNNIDDGINPYTGECVK